MLPIQQGQTYLARLEVDVGVADGCFEGDFGWRQWVVGWDVDGEEPEAAGVGAAGIAQAFEDGFPKEEVGVGRGPEVEASFARLGGEVLELVVEALEGRGG